MGSMAPPYYSVLGLSGARRRGSFHYPGGLSHTRPRIEGDTTGRPAEMGPAARLKSWTFMQVSAALTSQKGPSIWTFNASHRQRPGGDIHRGRVVRHRHEGRRLPRMRVN